MPPWPKRGRVSSALRVSFTRKPRKLNGFQLDRGRLALPDDQFFVQDPVRLLEIFHLADLHELEIHPLAMRAAQRDARLVDKNIRRDPKANALFLDILNPRVIRRYCADEQSTILADSSPTSAGSSRHSSSTCTIITAWITFLSAQLAGPKNKNRQGKGNRSRSFRLPSFGNVSQRVSLFVATLLHDMPKVEAETKACLALKVATLCRRPSALTCGDRDGRVVEFVTIF